MNAMAAQTPTRRQRLREQTFAEIKQRAREQLIAGGPHSISLRAIAREMSMAPAAIYRYFPSLTDLTCALVADLYNELSDALITAIAADPADEPVIRLGTASRAFRSWALEHRGEFALVFGGAHGGPDSDGYSGCHTHPDTNDACQRFGAVFADLFAEVYRHSDCEVLTTPTIPASLQAHLEGELATLLPDISLEARYLFLSCWIWLYGTVAMEVFGHLHFAVGENAEPMFEAQLAELATRLSSGRVSSGSP